MIISRASVGLLTLALLSTGPGCQQGESPFTGRPDNGLLRGGGPGEDSLAGREQVLTDEFNAQFESLGPLSAESFLEQHHLDYRTALDFDVADAAYRAELIQHFQLPERAVETLDQLGFVVMPAPERTPDDIYPTRGAGPADTYYRIFEAELPVFISADSILHAWHRSYDTLMRHTELRLAGILEDVLRETLGALEPENPEHTDARAYLNVALKLLEQDLWPVAADIEPEVSQILGWIEAGQLGSYSLFGEQLTIDFSLFKPRGHYTLSPTLERYFQAMSWIGKPPLVLYNPASGTTSARHETLARALVMAMYTSDAAVLYETIDRYYRALVGRTNGLNPHDLLELCEGAGLPSCEGDGAQMRAVYRSLVNGEQSVDALIGSQVVLRFLPQRFAVDSWVTAMTTFPRLATAMSRGMARVEDVAFALGSDRAGELFAEEFELSDRGDLPRTLEALQLTLAALPPSQLESTVYNHWLEAVMAYTGDRRDAGQPQVLMTGPWQDRKLEVLLASWAELRRDNILVVEQSTGGACQYPHGYVEPVPELYRALAATVSKLQEVYASSTRGLEHISEFFDHWRDVLARLEDIATRELAAQPHTEDDRAFINHTVDNHAEAPYMEERLYDGWYPRLFWTPMWGGEEIPDDNPSGIAEPVVADVHTDTESGAVLTVATGFPGLMVVAIDAPDGLRLHAGPVYSFYTFSSSMDRMTDEEWTDRVERGDLPEHPSFAAGYWCDDPPSGD